MTDPTLAAREPPPAAVLRADPAWRELDFLSDLHLSPQTPKTLAAFEGHLQTTPAQAVFLLGDVFEVWIGDDARFEPFEQACMRVLQGARQRMQLFFMAGNRDFLVGSALLADCGMSAPLLDPTLLQAFGQGWLLSHGDAQCLDDADYQSFRRQVRDATWQAGVLAQPLAARQQMGQQMRASSRTAQAAQLAATDLDADECRRWLRRAGSRTLIHGHTHRPRDHDLGDGLQRIVLSDWQLDEPPHRAQVLRLSADGLQRISLV